MTLKMRVMPRFPARLAGANGISAIRDNVDMVIKNDFSDMIQIPGVKSPDKQFFLSWNKDLDLYSILSFSNLFTSLTPEVEVLGDIFGLDADGQFSRIPTEQLAASLPIEMTGASAVRSLLSKINEVALSPKDFDITAGSGGDDTAAIQAAINYCNSSGRTLNLDGTWRVSSISLGAGAAPFSVVGRAYILGIATVATPAILTVAGYTVVFDGHIKVDGQYNTNYSQGLWFKGNPNLQYINLSNLSADRCAAAFKVGDEVNPSAIVSEIVIIGGSSYGCPVIGIIVGTETYVTLLGGFKSSDALGGDSAWAARPRRGLIVKGARVKVIGGELIQAGSGAATDFLVELQPLNKVDGTLDWGEAEVTELHGETAGPLALITNPNALTGTIANPGLFRVSGASGFHSQDVADFIQAAPGAGFTGDIVIGDNDFRFPGTRTKQDVQTNDNPCRVFLSAKGLGPGFKNTRAGVSGSAVKIIGVDGGVPTTYSPSLASGAGALTTATATGRYYRIGKLIHVFIAVTITTNGSGSGNISVGLPFAVASGAWAIMMGRENAVSGKLLQGFAGPGANVLQVVNYDNTYPAANGSVLYIEGVYEAA